MKCTHLPPQLSPNCHPGVPKGRRGPRLWEVGVEARRRALGPEEPFLQGYRKNLIWNAVK